LQAEDLEINADFCLTLHIFQRIKRASSHSDHHETKLQDYHFITQTDIFNTKAALPDAAKAVARQSVAG
jgi:hypothetical protein